MKKSNWMWGSTRMNLRSDKSERDVINFRHEKKKFKLEHFRGRYGEKTTI